MREFHIVSTGVSLLTNAQKNGLFSHDVRTSDERFWETQLDDPRILTSLYLFLQKDPRKYSAELNTFYRSTEGKDPTTIEVYLVGTKTAANEIVRRTLERDLTKKGHRIFIPYEIPGYFSEIQYFNPSQTAETFVQAFGDLLDHLLYLGMKKKKEGYRVFFNPTGGFKAHVILCALAGFLTGNEVYYMNEDFQSLIYFPHLFYLPKGREIELLKILASNPNISTNETESLFRSYQEEIDRLCLYQLIDLEEALSLPSNLPYTRIRLRPSAQLFLSQTDRE
jgi:putative CRISPR-associated protein (TIGR02619 family)